MPASDHVNRTLFHGTGHYFGENETIDPQEKSTNGNMLANLLNDNKPTVYMTDNIYKARHFASRAAMDKGLLFSQIYEVEDSPDIQSVHDVLTDNGYDEQTTGQGWAKGSYFSRNSVKPKKVAEWVINPEIKY